MSENQNKEKDIDSSPNDVKSEESSEDLHQKCFQLCKDYLGGVWMSLSFDDIVVNNIRQGLSKNNLFYCAVNSDKRRDDAKEPQEVVIRFYGKKHFITGGEVKDQRLTDAVVAVLASERNLGPKIYGLFEGGEIMKFYKVFHLFIYLYIIQIDCRFVCKA